jgi:putative nucleotidyltransferase with HDIG domain
MPISKVKQDQIELNMLLDRDVISPDGILLVTKGTYLTANHIVKINLYQIKDIFITTPNQEIQEIKQPQSKSLDETAAFIEFSFKYDQQVADVEQQLSHIIQTGDINSSSLADLVTDVLETASTQSHLFSFMCRLRSADDVTYNHSMNVSLLASILGKWLHMESHQIKDLALAGLLHDIGKVKVNQTILNKAGKLTVAEFEHIKQHTTMGYQIVTASDLPIGIKQAVLMHHEKMNGAGYPLGLKWENIHDYAKIIAIVDIYDAMTAERPYHKRFHPFQVIQMFEEECYGVLDTKYLFIFLEHIAQNFLGEQVWLSDDRFGTIIFINKNTPSRPIIHLEDSSMIDLSSNFNIKISSFL